MSHYQKEQNQHQLRTIGLIVLCLVLLGVAVAGFKHKYEATLQTREIAPPEEPK